MFSGGRERAHWEQMDLLIHLRSILPSYKNHSTVFQWKSIEWFLYRETFGSKWVKQEQKQPREVFCKKSYKKAVLKNFAILRPSDLQIY